jgi:hypothetical protein
VLQNRAAIHLIRQKWKERGKERGGGEEKKEEKESCIQRCIKVSRWWEGKEYPLFCGCALIFAISSCPYSIHKRFRVYYGQRQ